MPNYAILVDGERVARVDSEQDLRSWLLRYRADHVEDDPAAAHVQVVERGALAWLTGGKLVDREPFLGSNRPT
jgi:hypothetical protein